MAARVFTAWWNPFQINFCWSNPQGFQMTVGMRAARPPSDQNGRGYFGSRPIM
jgi:hypothetical protein